MNVDLFPPTQPKRPMKFGLNSGATITALRWSKGFCKGLVDRDGREAFVFIDDKKPEDITQWHPHMRDNIRIGDDVLIWLEKRSEGYDDVYVAKFCDYDLQPFSTRDQWLERRDAAIEAASRPPQLELVPDRTQYSGEMKNITTLVPIEVHAILKARWMQRQQALGKSYFQAHYIRDLLTQLAEGSP